MTIADSEPVKKVRKALKDAGLADSVVELDAPMESAAEAAKALDVEPGAVVTSRIYAIGKRMVLVLVAGDHECLEANLAAAFFLEGEVRVPSDAEVRGVTGFTADCVPPAGFAHKLPTAIDRSLKRFQRLYAAAGDPQCVFKTSVTDLKRLTEGIVSYNIARPLEGEAEVPPMPRNKTFTGERKVPGVEDVVEDGAEPG
ncbi:MAG: YbaK/EbsC family protein [Proteobacteria bacterium]|nr:YbaK/EbsC family protein [Pseudomonadota bacterium]